MGPTSVTQTPRPDGDPRGLSWPRTPHRPMKCVPGLSCLQAPHCAACLCRHRSLSKGSTCRLLDTAVGLASSPRTAGKRRCASRQPWSADAGQMGRWPLGRVREVRAELLASTSSPLILRTRETVAQWCQLRLTRERPVEVCARRQCPLLERAWLACCLWGPQPRDGRVSQDVFLTMKTLSFHRTLEGLGFITSGVAPSIFQFLLPSSPRPLNGLGILTAASPAGVQTDCWPSLDDNSCE